jgi:hypothetical protein
MAAAAPWLVYLLFSQPTHWLEHQPDWTTLQNTFAVGSGQDTNQVRVHLTNLAHRSPVAVCLTIQGNPANIYVCHNPTIFLGNPANVTPFNNHCVVLLGDDIDNATPMVLPNNCFACRVIRALTHAHIVGAQGHNAAPPVFRAGPHGAGTANTDKVKVRSMFLMNPVHAVAHVEYMDMGVYSLLGFYSKFIELDATSGVAAQKASVAPLLNCYWAACTNDNAGESAIAINTVTSALPLQNPLLQGWAARCKNLMKVALGTGGLPLVLTNLRRHHHLPAGRFQEDLHRAVWSLYCSGHVQPVRRRRR